MASGQRARKQDQQAPRPDLKLVQKHQADDPPEMTEEEYLEHVAEFADTLSDKELMCRRMGQHDFKPYTATVNKKTLAIYEVMRCARCKTLRAQDMSGRGIVVKSNYRHPPGYLDKGHGRLTGQARGILRVASVMRGNVVWVDDEGNPTNPPSPRTLKKVFKGKVTGNG